MRREGTSTAAGTPDIDRPSGSLRAIGLRFVRTANGAILCAWFAGAALARAVVGGWTPVDLMLAVVLLVAQPFVEWMVHRHLMHGPPISLGSRMRPRPLSREHGLHHLEPDAPHFMPVPIVLAVATLVTLGAFVAMPTAGLALTAVTVLSFELLAYVWVHLLLHADHEPATGWLRGQRRAHQRHHLVSDRRDLGVVTPWADAVFGTRSVDR